MSSRTDPHPGRDMPNPTPEQRATPEFEAIWNVIKSWDVNVPEFYDGYCGANGSHVVLILDALESVSRSPDLDKAAEATVSGCRSGLLAPTEEDR